MSPPCVSLLGCARIVTCCMLCVDYKPEVAGGWSEVRDLLLTLGRLDRVELLTGSEIRDPGSLLLFMIASLKWEVFGLVGRRGVIPPLGTPGGYLTLYFSR